MYNWNHFPLKKQKGAPAWEAETPEDPVCSSGLWQHIGWQSTTAAWTCKAYSPWRASESPMPHAAVSTWWTSPLGRLHCPDGKCSCTLVFWIFTARVDRRTTALFHWPRWGTIPHPWGVEIETRGWRLGSDRTEVTGLCLMARGVWRGGSREEGGSQPSDRIELTFLLQPPVHSDLLVIYLMEGIQWRAGISTVTFYPHQMFALKTR